jgi:hypothetical protein
MSGSRYGRSSENGGSRRQQGKNGPVVAVRNDRFFIGSRYGKRNEEPPVTTDGTYRINVTDRCFWVYRLLTQGVPKLVIQN